ncbi:MAG: DsrE/DsrF/DrsH-like family protein [Desulfobacterales bacterium]|nr:MAG: DsrE/DsrF/DrsH-like family protein [Desulfobacterales bacterium]
MTEKLQEETDKRRKATIFVISGDLEKLFAAFSIAIGAATCNIEVKMFFTFWGLRALKKNVHTGESLFARMLGILESGDINKANPGKYKFLGLGRWMFKKMVKEKNVTGLAELRQLAINLGVELYSCDTTMEVMEIPKEKLIDKVADPVGVGWLIEQSLQSDFIYSL